MTTPVPPYAEFIAVRTELRRVADALAALLDATRKEQEDVDDDTRQRT